MIHLPVAICALLESAINGVLALDTAGASHITPLHGKVVGFEVTDIQLTFVLLFGANGRVTVMGRYDNTADAWVKGSSVALTRMSFAALPNEAVLKGEVAIEGDTHAVAAVSRFLKGIDIDWEEQLSRFTGDIVAHQVGRAVRGLSSWINDVGTSLRSDLSEYLRYETKWLPDAETVQQHLLEVDRIRHDVERLQVRIQRLQVGRQSRTAKADVGPEATA